MQKLIRKQNIIQSTLADLAEDITEIKNKIDQNNKNSNLVEDADSVFTAINLPVQSNDDLQKLEEYLGVEKNMNTAVSINFIFK